VDAEAADAAPREAMPFTPKQGQYLAFIYYYTKISGDPHLSKLERYEGVPIVTPAEAVKRLGL